MWLRCAPRYCFGDRLKIIPSFKFMAIKDNTRRTDSTFTHLLCYWTFGCLAPRIFNNCGAFTLDNCMLTLKGRHYHNVVSESIMKLACCDLHEANAFDPTFISRSALKVSAMTTLVSRLLLLRVNFRWSSRPFRVHFSVKNFSNFKALEWPQHLHSYVTYSNWSHTYGKL